MGATIFGFLTESFFFDRALIADKFRTIDEKRLRAELRAYRDFCLSSKAEIESEVSANKSSLKVLSGVECPDVRLLKQSAFYIEQYILPDPLFAMTHESGQMNDAISSYLGMGQSVIDRDRLATILSYLHSLTPMVAANYVKFLPLSYIFEPPKNTSIYASYNY